MRSQEASDASSEARSTFSLYSGRVRIDSTRLAHTGCRLELDPLAESVHSREPRPHADLLCLLAGLANLPPGHLWTGSGRIVRLKNVACRPRAPTTV